ncbi:tyrosine-type recombinase/integrase [Leifsonia sp. Leaf264]|uniref:tyrosine-type recombinase/integrase n=1 Tax=Leifsonia sp. Leaf264 TaxID=1736314 RepID=UPI00138ED197|nr:tyrosine-type recombinase/integrase [Leifsonia sp. Leaf264]
MTRESKELAADDIKDKCGRRARAGKPAVSKDPLVSEFIDLYLARVRRLTEQGKLAVQTEERYRSSANNRVLDGFGALRASEVEAGDIIDFLDEVSENHLSEARNCRVVLRGVFHEAVKAKAIAMNPVVAAAVRIEVPKKSPRRLTMGDLIELRKLVSEWRTAPGTMGPRPTNDLIDLIDVMLGTGARISEILSLQPDDVFVETNDDGEDVVCLRLRSTLVYAKGLGIHRQDRPKTDASNREIAVPKSAAELILRRTIYGGGTWLWTNRDGGPMWRSRFAVQLNKVTKGTELEWVSSHIFRKTAASEIADVVGLAAAQAQLGHEDQRTTQDIYVERKKKAPDLRAVLERLSSRSAA